MAMLPSATDYIAESAAGAQGYEEELLLTPGDWRDLTGAVLAPATTGLGVARDNSVLTVLHFGGAVDQTAGLETSWTIPGQAFRADASRGARPDLRIGFSARKVDTTGSAVENATLQLIATALVLPNGTATPTTLGTFTQLLPARTGNLASDAYVEYRSGNLLASATQAVVNLIQPGSTLILRLTVNQAVGTALAVRVKPVRVQYSRNARVLPAFNV